MGLFMLFNDWNSHWFVVGFGVGGMMIRLGLHSGEVEIFFLGVRRLTLLGSAR